MLKIIGHRGALGLAPENTIASINKALEYNVDEVEIDVHVTKDGVPVLNHDPFLKDSSDTEQLIIEHTLAQLLKIKADLATLEEAIRVIDRRKPTLVEVKPEVEIVPVVAVIKNFLAKKWQPNDFLIGSKSQKTLLALHRELPDLETVVIENWSGVWASLRARQLGTKRVSMKQMFLWSGFIKSMARSGYKLAAWRLDDPVKAKRWAKYGLYGAITDYPDRFRDKK